ncbi:hypothetical protein [Thiolapillus brandeum]|uniref:Uncharacterized protein n=1 Tax=Thiolapillus brandeum TaxID=1076588 RepID=A0A7U6GJB6_9GAMM|nr:hypothetical protein [Thiolapillus brandeum]BAO44654.1 conserved hypothetical protein [Thiolapillus brandeum]
MGSYPGFLFPEHSRCFPGQRWVNISLRTLHLIGLSGAGYGFFVHGHEMNWEAFLLLTIFSGTAMMLISIWSNGIWLLQLRGQAIMLKLLLLALALALPPWRAALFVGVLVISGLISHAPGNVRYYSLLYGRRIDHLPASS